jgi:ABC-2 type transport system ATP-binding protein
MNEVVSIRNVTKTFGNKKAVEDMSFTIQKGEVVAILGPNGAGKTTTISMLLGLLIPQMVRFKYLIYHRRIKGKRKVRNNAAGS